MCCHQDPGLTDCKVGGHVYTSNVNIVNMVNVTRPCKSPVIDYFFLALHENGL